MVPKDKTKFDVGDVMEKLDGIVGHGASKKVPQWALHQTYSFKPMSVK